MFSLKSKYTPTLGLDIGSSALRAVEIRPVGKGWRLHRWGIESLPADTVVDGKIKNMDNAVKCLQSLIVRAGITTKQVAISVGGPAVIIKKIQLPFMTELELEDQISLEAEEYIPFDIDDVHLDFQILGQKDGNLDVMLTACKKELTADHLEACQAAGLHPTVCDLDLFCIANAYDTFIRGATEQTKIPQKGQPPLEVVGLVNAGSSYLNIAILRGDVPEFTRDFSFGGRQMMQDIQDRMKLSLEEVELFISQSGKGHPAALWESAQNNVLLPFEEKLAAQIRQSLDFYNNSHPVEEKVTSVLLSGGCALIPGVSAFLSESLGTPVAVGNPLPQIQPSKEKGVQPFPDVQAPRFMVAFGLALRGKSV